MSSSFVKIFKNSLELQENFTGIFQQLNQNQKKFKFISIIGKARTGKSAFVNCLISHWEKENLKIFETSDLDEHCTNGVDWYQCKNVNIVILDFQGIFLHDSSQDIKLLLLAYLISDVIIFNEPHLLTSATLALFEPMLTFLNFVDINSDKLKHPKLIFRIKDKQLKLDPTENMTKMLAPQEDQFQNIRECIHQLFDDPFAIYTNSLDRAEMKMMQENNFFNIIENKDTNFSEAIFKIDEYLSCVPGSRTMQEFLNDVPKIIKRINTEKKIKFEELDVVKNLAKSEIFSFINDLDKGVYAEIKVDGTQCVFDGNIVPRMLEKDRILKEVHKKFRNTPKAVRDDSLLKFSSELQAVIDKAQNENKRLAEQLILTILKKHNLFNFNLHLPTYPRGNPKFFKKFWN